MQPYNHVLVKPTIQFLQCMSPCTSKYYQLGECLDFLTLTRDSLGGQPVSTCGCVGVDNNTYSDFNINEQGYEPQKLQVRFRSNKKCRADGYFLWAFCIDVAEQSSPGCISSRKRREVHISSTIGSPTVSLSMKIVH